MTNKNWYFISALTSAIVVWALSKDIGDMLQTGKQSAVVIVFALGCFIFGFSIARWFNNE